MFTFFSVRRWFGKGLCVSMLLMMSFYDYYEAFWGSKHISAQELVLALHSEINPGSGDHMEAGD